MTRWAPPIPADFALALRQLREAKDPRLNMALHAAVGAGWTLKALGDGLGMSLEAVRQRVLKARFFPADQLPTVPPVPPRAMPEPRPFVAPPPTLTVEETAALRIAHAVARTVNGATPVGHRSRRVSEELAATLAVHVARGVQVAHIARQMGVTPAAVNFRLGRHGYREQPASVPETARRYRNRCIRKVDDVGGAVHPGGAP